MKLSRRLWRLTESYVRQWFEKDPSEDPVVGQAPPGKEDAWDWDPHAEDDVASPEMPARMELFYRRLEIPVGSDLETVKQAWKGMMRKYHPDRFGREPEKIALATRLSQEITEAYLELTRFLKNAPTSRA